MEMSKECKDLHFWLPYFIEHIKSEVAAAELQGQSWCHDSPHAAQCYAGLSLFNTYRHARDVGTNTIVLKVCRLVRTFYSLQGGEAVRELTKLRQTLDFMAGASQITPSLPVEDALREEVRAVRTQCHELKQTPERVSTEICELKSQMLRQHDGTLNGKHVQLHGCKIGGIDPACGTSCERVVEPRTDSFFPGLISQPLNGSDTASQDSWVNVGKSSSSSASGISVAMAGTCCFTADSLFKAVKLATSNYR